MEYADPRTANLLDTLALVEQELRAAATERRYGRLALDLHDGLTELMRCERTIKVPRPLPKAA